MVYRKAPGQGPSISEPLRSWGTFTRHLEIGDDQFVVRQVDVFVNGYAVRYDRTHWVDDLGMLADSRYRPKVWERWWGPGVPMTADEFEQVWAAAESSPVYQLQLATAKISRWGAVPVCLRLRADDEPDRVPSDGV